jgi:hypothetical protein
MRDGALRSGVQLCDHALTATVSIQLPCRQGSCPKLHHFLETAPRSSPTYAARVATSTSGSTKRPRCLRKRRPANPPNYRLRDRDCSGAEQAQFAGGAPRAAQSLIRSSTQMPSGGSVIRMAWSRPWTRAGYVSKTPSLITLLPPYCASSLFKISR